MPKQKHILAIRLSAMGDVAISVPVIENFVAQNPTVKVTVLTRGFFTPFFKDIPNVSVFAADLNGKHKGVFGLYKLSKELKKLGITQVADLHSVLRTNILKFFFFGRTFVQIDKGRTESKSSVGLGLSIASDIIRSHGGNIMLEKSKMNGLRVKIFLPV